MAEAASITIVEDGPYVVRGGVPLSEDAIVAAPEGSHLQYNRVRDHEVHEEYHLCRCGASHHKPFCDGAHEAPRPRPARRSLSAPTPTEVPSCGCSTTTAAPSLGYATAREATCGT